MIFEGLSDAVPIIFLQANKCSKCSLMNCSRIFLLANMFFEKLKIMRGKKCLQTIGNDCNFIKVGLRAVVTPNIWESFWNLCFGSDEI